MEDRAGEEKRALKERKDLNLTEMTLALGLGTATLQFDSLIQLLPCLQTASMAAETKLAFLCVQGAFWFYSRPPLSNTDYSTQGTQRQELRRGEEEPASSKEARGGAVW